MSNDRKDNPPWLVSSRLTALVLVACCGVAVAESGDGKRQPSAVDIPSDYADADAVILQWEQSWSKAADGTVKRHEIKHVLLRNDRAYRAFADQRLTYNADYQTVKVLKARTVCPDGRVLEIPEYGRNAVSPRATAGWPDFASIRETVYSFSGIEPGAILEFEWEITTRPGLWRHVELECRLHDRYPILLRRIRMFGGDVHEYKNLDGVPSEAAAVEWRDAGRHVSYSGCGDQKTWTRLVLDGIEAATKRTAALEATAQEWTDGKTDPQQRARAIQKKLKKRLSIVQVPIDCASDRLRTADRVLSTHYGRPVEAAALLLAMFRAAGLDAEPIFVQRGSGAAEVRPAITEYGVRLGKGTDATYWTVSHGRVRDPGPWGGWKRYDYAFANSERHERLGRFSESARNELTITGTVVVDEKAAWTADLAFRVEGVFMPPGSLREKAQQKTTVKAILKRSLSHAKLGEFAVTSLSEDAFAVSLKATSTEPLREIDGDYLLELPQSPAWEPSISVPLDPGRRETTVRLAGAFTENVKLVFDLPSGWSLAGRPDAIERPLPGDGLVRRIVDVDGGRVTFRRQTHIGNRDITAAEYGTVRDALNLLRSLSARSILLTTPSSTDDARSARRSQEAH